MKLFDLVYEETKQESSDKAVSGFTISFNKVGRHYDYKKSGFITKGAVVLKGDKLPLKLHTVTGNDVKSKDKGTLYATK